MRRTGVVAAATAAVLLATLGGCASVPTSVHASAPTPDHASVRLPDAHAGFDYQLGGAYAPPAGVTVVERDRTAKPAKAGYDICYVNGFQTQPDASAQTARAHPGLLLRVHSTPVADPGWPDEYLFDTATARARSALAALVGPWIRDCARAGFDAVEIDNLDSYTRSKGALTSADNLAMATEYARIAHDAGLAIAQKNTADLSARLAAAGYDFAITESCAAYDECAAYAGAYPVVLDIEYADQLATSAFDAACGRTDRPGVMILRDHALVPRDDPHYVYRSCPA